MGMFNTYGDTQLKVGELSCHQYNIGDEADIPNGVYVGLEGVIVVTGGKFTAEFKHVTSKWGDEIKPHAIIDQFHWANPIMRELITSDKPKKEK